MEENNIEIEPIIEPAVEPVSEPILSKKERKAMLYRERIINAPNNDIKYRGPLNIHGLKIIGWSLFIIGYLATLLTIGAMTKDPVLIAFASTPFPAIMSAMASISVPCFLLGRFGIIFQKKNGYKRLIIQYAFCALLVCIAFFAVYLRYIVTIVQVIGQISYGEALQKLNGTIANIFGKKAAFNLFIDLFIYTIFITFASYDNKNWKKWQHYLFRLCTIIPTLYIIAGFIFRMFHAFGTVSLPVYLMPILPTNSPVSFFVFAMIIIAIKLRQRKFKKMGGTEEQYEEYSKTKRSSWFFAKNTALAFIIGGIMDIIIVAIFTSYISTIVSPDDPYFVATVSNTIGSMGFGGTFTYILFSPIVLLYSYNRVHKQSTLDFIIPSSAIAIIIFMTIEFGFQAIVIIIGNMTNGMIGE